MQCRFLLDNSASRQRMWRTCTKSRRQALQETCTTRSCDSRCHSIAISQPEPEAMSIYCVTKKKTYEGLTKYYDLGIEGRPQPGL